MSEALHEENEALHEVWMPLHEAATVLGISPRAVQLRAEKGKIRRDRQDGRVVFCVAASRSVDAESEVPQAALHEENEAVHEADTKPDTTYVAHLEEEVQFLRAQVETHQQNEAELRRLMLADKNELQALRQKVALLAVPTALDAVQDALETRSAKVETNAGIYALEVSPRPKKWWEFWRS